jgi:hypothetical protein
MAKAVYLGVACARTTPSQQAEQMCGTQSPRWREDDVRVRSAGGSDTSEGKDAG